MPVDQTVNRVERARWNNEHWTTAWPRREQLTGSVTPLLMEAAALAPGERVLDVGSGAGIASLHAAELVGPGGEVVGADISVALVDYAGRRVASRAPDEAAGAAPMRFVVADVQQEPVEGAPFDVAISQFGVMFFDDPVVAFARIREQLVPGGRLAFVCWQGIELNPWNVAPALAPFVSPPVPPPPGVVPPGPFSLADPDRLRSVLTAAGWSQIERDARELHPVIDDSAVFDEDQLASLEIAPDRWAAAREAVDAHLAPLRRPDGRLDAVLAIQIVTARA